MMTDDQFQHLSDQIATLVEGQERLERLTANFAAKTEERFRDLEEQLTRLEVRVESMQDDIKGLAEGIQSLRERMDALEAKVA